MREGFLKYVDVRGEDVLLGIQVLGAAGRSRRQQRRGTPPGMPAHRRTHTAPLRRGSQRPDGGAVGAGDRHERGEQEVDQGWAAARAADMTGRRKKLGQLVDDGMAGAVLRSSDRGPRHRAACSMRPVRSKASTPAHAVTEDGLTSASPPRPIRTSRSGRATHARACRLQSSRGRRGRTRPDGPRARTRHAPGGAATNSALPWSVTSAQSSRRHQRGSVLVEPCIHTRRPSASRSLTRMWPISPLTCFGQIGGRPMRDCSPPV